MMAPNIWDGDAGLYRCEDGGVLRLMAKEVEACNRKNGWYDKDRTFGDDIALLHSELSEALEAWRDGTRGRAVLGGGFPYTEVVPVKDGDPYPLGYKPVGMPSELADVLVRLLDTAQRYGVDLFAEYRAKLDYNWKREYRHGGKAL